MPVIARFFGINNKNVPAPKRTQNFTSLKFEGGASYGSQSAKCIND